MSVSNNFSNFKAFRDEVCQADPDLFNVVNKLPQDAIEGYTIDSDGNFELHFSKAQTGVARHLDESWHKRIGGTVIKTSQTVKGAIDKANKSLKFSTGSIVAEAKFSLITANFNLLEIKVLGNQNLELKASKNLLIKDIELSTKVQESIIEMTEIEWK